MRDFQSVNQFVHPCWLSELVPSWTPRWLGGWGDPRLRRRINHCAVWILITCSRCRSLPIAPMDDRQKRGTWSTHASGHREQKKALQALDPIIQESLDDWIGNLESFVRDVLSHV